MTKRKAKTKAKRPWKYYRKKTFKTKIPSSIANNMLVKLKYVENLVFDLSNVYPQIHTIYRVNDLYDPNYSSTGHQPYLRDQLYTLYNIARCLSSRITVQFVSEAPNIINVVLFPLATTTAESNFFVGAERPGGKSQIMNHVSRTFLQAKTSTHKALGVPRAAIKNNEEYIQYEGGALSTSCCNFWQVGAELIGTSASIKLLAIVKIEMVVLFSEPKQNTYS